MRSTNHTSTLLVVVIALVGSCSANPRFIRGALFPGAQVRNNAAALETGSAGLNYTVNATGTISISAIVTGEPSLTTAPPTSTVEGDCTPKSICVDYLTCSKRFGHCYDKNNCNGSRRTISLPTC